MGLGGGGGEGAPGSANAQNTGVSKELRREMLELVFRKYLLLLHAGVERKPRASWKIKGLSPIKVGVEIRREGRRWPTREAKGTRLLTSLAREVGWWSIRTRLWRETPQRYGEWGRRKKMGNGRPNPLLLPPNPLL